MANRRMFTLDIIDSDNFLKMKPAAQNLYFQIGMRCDDDGICDNAFSIIALIGVEKDCLNELLDRHLILDTKIGVYVIKHWWLHNAKRFDRYTPSRYLRKLKLYLDENGSYTFKKTNLPYTEETNPSTKMSTKMSTKRNTQDKLSKDKLSKDKLSKDNISLSCDSEIINTRSRINNNLSQSQYEDEQEWDELLENIGDTKNEI